MTISTYAPSPSEHEEQIAFVQWFRRQYPGMRLFAIPNGGARNVVVAAKLKAEGVSAGVPDLFIPAMRLFIEMKRKHGGTVSHPQKEWMEYLTGVGYRCMVCRGADDAIDKVKNFTLPA